MIRMSREHSPQELSRIILALMKALQVKDFYTFAHSERVGYYAETIAREMQLREDEIYTARILGCLHDIGKLFVPDGILQKSGSLSEMEWAAMRRHAMDAVRVLSCMDVKRDYLDVVRAFHERFDGTGYPDGLAAGGIPLISRIISVADSYDAMVTDRPYRKAQPMEYVLSELLRERGKQFSPDVVDVALDLVVRNILSTNGHTPAPAGFFLVVDL